MRLDVGPLRERLCPRCRIVRKFIAGTAPLAGNADAFTSCYIEPLCRLCLEAGRVTPGDRRRPYRAAQRRLHRVQGYRSLQRAFTF
jgi:hypothetical protein